MEKEEVVESTTEKEVVESTTENTIDETIEERGLAIPKMQDMSLDLFASDNQSKIKRITSLDITNDEDADMLLNASQEADHKLNDEVDKEITVIGCSMTERLVDTVNDDTGEVITRKKHTLCLFDINGESHVTGSNSCYLSFTQIVSLKGMPTREKPLVLIPCKAPAKEKGHEYLRLKVKTIK